MRVDVLNKTIMASRVPPSRELLTRFLRERRAPSIDEAAALAGWSTAQVERELAGRGRGVLEWSEVASWIVDSWPLATLFQKLGSDADLLPLGLQLIPMPLQQPAYIVSAFHAQWQIEPMPHRTIRPLTFADYMTDLLHRAINAETVDALRDDQEFIRAYESPHGEIE